MSESTLYDELGGRPSLEKVHKIFYDKIYADPWIGKFFSTINQTLIENQQTEFMMQAMGGPKIYQGAFPIPAHKHMFITEDLFTYRHELLKASLKEAGIREDLAAKWLKIDGAFKTGIVKSTLEQCEKRFKTDDLIIVNNPFRKAA